MNEDVLILMDVFFSYGRSPYLPQWALDIVDNIQHLLLPDIEIHPTTNSMYNSML